MALFGGVSFPSLGSSSSSSSKTSASDKARAAQKKKSTSSSSKSSASDKARAYGATQTSAASRAAAVRQPTPPSTYTYTPAKPAKASTAAIQRKYSTSSKSSTSSYSASDKARSYGASAPASSKRSSSGYIPAPEATSRESYRGAGAYRETSSSGVSASDRARSYGGASQASRPYLPLVTSSGTRQVEAPEYVVTPPGAYVPPLASTAQRGLDLFSVVKPMLSTAWDNRDEVAAGLGSLGAPKVPDLVGDTFRSPAEMGAYLGEQAALSKQQVADILASPTAQTVIGKLAAVGTVPRPSNLAGEIATTKKLASEEGLLPAALYPMMRVFEVSKLPVFSEKFWASGWQSEQQVKASPEYRRLQEEDARLAAAQRTAGVTPGGWLALARQRAEISNEMHNLSTKAWVERGMMTVTPEEQEEYRTEAPAWLQLSTGVLFDPLNFADLFMGPATKAVRLARARQIYRPLAEITSPTTAAEILRATPDVVQDLVREDWWRANKTLVGKLDKVPGVGKLIQPTAQMRQSLLVDETSDFLNTVIHPVDPEHVLLAKWVQDINDPDVLETIGPIAQSWASVQSRALVRQVLGATDDADAMARAARELVGAEERVTTAQRVLQEARNTLEAATQGGRESVEARQANLRGRAEQARNRAANARSSADTQQARLSQMEADVASGRRTADSLQAQRDLIERERLRARNAVIDAERFERMAAQPGVDMAAPQRRAVQQAQDELDEAMEQVSSLRLATQGGGVDVSRLAQLVIDSADDPYKAVAELAQQFENATETFIGVPRKVTIDGVEKTIYAMPLKNPYQRFQGAVNNWLSIAYMGNNPGYAFRNAANNLITAMADGVSPFQSNRIMGDFYVRWGIPPMATMKGLGSQGDVWKSSEKALAHIADAQRPMKVWEVFKGVNWSPTKGPFLQIGQSFERMASQRIMYHHLDNFWRQVWPKSVRSIRQQLAEMVPELNPSQAELYARRISLAMNPKEMRQVVSDMAREASDLRRVPDAATLERASGAGPGAAETVADIARMSDEGQEAAVEILRVNDEVAQAATEVAERVDEIAERPPRLRPIPPDADPVTRAAIAEENVPGLLQYVASWNRLLHDFTVAQDAATRSVRQAIGRVRNRAEKVRLWQDFRTRQTQQWNRVLADLDNLHHSVGTDVGFSDEAADYFSQNSREIHDIMQEIAERQNDLWGPVREMSDPDAFDQALLDFQAWRDRRMGIVNEKQQEFQQRLTGYITDAKLRGPRRPPPPDDAGGAGVPPPEPPRRPPPGGDGGGGDGGGGAPVAGPAAPAQPALIGEAGAPLPDWLRHNVDEIVSALPQSTKDRIEYLAAQRYTARQIAQELGTDEQSVRLARVGLGIPSQTIGGPGLGAQTPNPDFDVWLRQYNARAGAVAAPPAPAAPAAARTTPEVVESLATRIVDGEDDAVVLAGVNPHDNTYVAVWNRVDELRRGVGRPRSLPAPAAAPGPVSPLRYTEPAPMTDDLRALLSKWRSGEHIDPSEWESLGLTRDQWADAINTSVRETPPEELPDLLEGRYRVVQPEPEAPAAAATPPPVDRTQRTKEMWTEVAHYIGKPLSEVSPQQKLNTVRKALRVAELPEIDTLADVGRFSDEQFDAVLAYAGRDRSENQRLAEAIRQREIRQEAAERGPFGTPGRDPQIEEAVNALRDEVVALEDAARELTDEQRRGLRLDVRLKRARSILDKAGPGNRNISLKQIESMADELRRLELPGPELAPQPRLEPEVPFAPEPEVRQIIEQVQANTNSAIKTRDISLDPARFQYKLEDIDQATGTTKSLARVEEWDPDLGKGISVWVDPADGKTYVVNGHHRVELAKRLGADEILSPYFIDAETAEQARLIGAMQNIAEGRGTAVDAGKVFRELGADRSFLRRLPISEGNVNKGLALAGLNDTLFMATINKVLPLDLAVVIGQKLPNLPDMQMQVFRVIDEAATKGDKLSAGLVSELAEAMVNGPTQTFTQTTLFGVEEVVTSLALERARFYDYVRTRLSKEKSLFKGAARNAEELARVGKIDAIEAKRIGSSAEQNIELFDVFKNQRGPVSQLGDEAAAAIARGEKNAREDYYERLINDALPRALRGEGGDVAPPRPDDAAALGRDIEEPGEVRPVQEGPDLFAAGPEEVAEEVPPAAPTPRPGLAELEPPEIVAPRIEVPPEPKSPYVGPRGPQGSTWRVTAEDEIEIRFPGKPDDDVRRALLDQGFKYDATTRTWYKEFLGLESADDVDLADAITSPSVAKQAEVPNDLTTRAVGGDAPDASPSVHQHEASAPQAPDQPAAAAGSDELQRVPQPSRATGRSGITPFREDANGVRYISADILPDVPQYVSPAKIDDILRRTGGEWTMMEHQVDNANRVLDAFSKEKAFVIADATGTGKTYSGSLVIDEMFDRGAKNILLVAPNDGLIQQWRDVAEPIGIKLQRVKGDFDISKASAPERTIFVTTYSATDKWILHPHARKSLDLVIFDESHTLKNAYDGTQRALNGKMIAEYAEKQLFMSATPMESVFHYDYLVDYLGVHAHFQHMLNEMGIIKKIDPITKQSYWVGLSPQKLRDLHQKLVREGVFVRHEMSFRSIFNKQTGELKHMASAALPVPMSEEGARQYNALIGIYDDYLARYPEYAKTIGGLRVNDAKGMLEQDKVRVAVEVGKRKLAEGKSVAFFTFRKSDVDWDARIANVAGKPMAKVLRPLYRELRAAGIEMASPVQALTNAFPEAVVVTGDQVAGKAWRNQNVQAFMSGKARVMVVTQAAGGTGLSLHDKVGKFPRVQINLTTPYTAMQMEQIAGRTFRMGSQSDAEMYWLYNLTPLEEKYARRTMTRMQEMGAIVTGDQALADDREMLEFVFSDSESYVNTLERDVFASQAAIDLAPRITPPWDRPGYKPEYAPGFPKKAAQPAAPPTTPTREERIASLMEGRPNVTREQAERAVNATDAEIAAPPEPYKRPPLPEGVADIAKREIGGNVGGIVRVSEYPELRNLVVGRDYESDGWRAVRKQVDQLDQVTFTKLQDATAQGPFQVDEKLILRSPHLEGTDLYETTVNFRGSPDGRNAVVWTGTAQITVPLDRLRRSGPPLDFGGGTPSGVGIVAPGTQRSFQVFDSIASGFRWMREPLDAVRRAPSVPVDPLTPEQARRLMSFTDRVAVPAMLRDKAVVGKAATNARNFALGDYSHKLNLHQMLTYLYPYSFWYTFTYPNWAQRFAQHPAYLADYARYRRIIHDANQERYREMTGDPNAEMPEYWRDQIYVPFGNTEFGFNLEQSLNPLQGLTLLNFDPRERMEAPLGKIWNALNAQGPTTFSPYTWVYALALYALGHVDAAAQWWGYTIPQERVLRGLTALAREKIPGAEKVIPAGGWTPSQALPWNQTTDEYHPFGPGGDFWDVRRIPAAVVSLYENGGMTQEQAEAAGYQRAGNAQWDEAAQDASLKRLLPNLAALLVGQGYKPRDITDIEIDKMWKERIELNDQRDALPADQYYDKRDALRAKYPWMELFVMARENDPLERLASYMWIVRSRLAPGSTQKQALADAGLTYDDFDLLKSVKYDMSKLDPQDLARLKNGVEKLAETVLAPTPEERVQWQAAYDARRDAQRKGVPREVPGQALSALGVAGATPYGTDVSLAWLTDLQNQYFNVPEEDRETRYKFLEDYPELGRWWNQTTDYEKNTAAAPYWRDYTDDYWDAVPPGSRWKEGLSIPDEVLDVMDAMYDDELRAKLTEDQVKAATEWLTKNVPSKYQLPLPEKRLMQDFNGQFQRSAVEQFGADILDLANEYGALGNKTAKSAWASSHAEEYARLKEYWDYKRAYAGVHDKWGEFYGFGPDTYSGWTRIAKVYRYYQRGYYRRAQKRYYGTLSSRYRYQQYSKKRYYSGSYKRYSRSYSSTYKRYYNYYRKSYGRSYSSGYRSYSGGGYSGGGYSRGGGSWGGGGGVTEPSVISQVPTAPAWQSMLLTDFNSQLQAVREKDTSFDTAANTLFGSGVVTSFLAFLALSDAERKTWLADPQNAALAALFARFMGWFTQQLEATEGGSDRLLESLPPTTPLPPAVPSVVPPAAVVPELSTTEPVLPP